MSKRVIATTQAPGAIGPYSQAIQSGSMLFVSGQISMDPESGIMQGDDVASQTRRALDNLKAVIAAADGTLDQVVKTTVYLSSMDDFAAMNEVYAEYFVNTPPARAAIEAARLPKDALVEIDAIAMLS